MTNAIPLGELCRNLERKYKGGRFRRCVLYNQEGDALEVYLAPGPHIAYRVDPLLTVFATAGDLKKVAGFAIKGIAKHLKTFPSSQIWKAVPRPTIEALIWAAWYVSANLRSHGVASQAMEPDFSGSWELFRKLLRRHGGERVDIAEALSAVPV